MSGAGVTAIARPDRSRYAPSLRQFMEQLDQEELSEVVRQGRTNSLQQVSALAGHGLVSSSTLRVGEATWRLRFTGTGRALRKLLLAEAARA